MAEIQGIQWFPGHMTKTKRQIKESIKLIDAVAEIVDARVPMSSRNPDLSEMSNNKPRLILLNKCDMADPNATKKWLEYFEKKGIKAIAVDCKSGMGLKQFVPAVKDLLSERLAALKEKGMSGKALRVMVAGIPNVGKSSFINKIVGGTKAKVEDRPGVTRGNQWFSVQGGIDLLDTPGVLWPKFEDQQVGERLAFTGAVKDAVVDIELLAMRLLDVLAVSYPELLTERYKITDFEMDSYDLLCAIGKKRGMVIRGGETDTERAAAMLLEEYRNCKIGQITLERVEDNA